MGVRRDDEEYAGERRRSLVEESQDELAAQRHDAAFRRVRVKWSTTEVLEFDEEVEIPAGEIADEYLHGDSQELVDVDPREGELTSFLREIESIEELEPDRAPRRPIAEELDPYERSLRHSAAQVLQTWAGAVGDDEALAVARATLLGDYEGAGEVALRLWAQAPPYRVVKDKTREELRAEYGPDRWRR